MILDTNDIQKILPHRYPFLMVDAILEMERLKRIVGVKNVSINEDYFQGHFPGKPIMPGVLVIEAMAQTGGILLLQEVPDREKKLLYFVAVDDARSEEHTSELQSRLHLVCRLLLEKKKQRREAAGG